MTDQQTPAPGSQMVQGGPVAQPGNPREDQGVPESLTVLRYLAEQWPGMSSDERDEAIRLFFAEREVVLAGLARYQCRRSRLSLNRDLDDVHSVIQMTAWESFQQAVTDPDYLNSITVSWEYHVDRKAANRVNSLSRAEQARGLSGADRVLRRQRSLEAHRRRMVAETGREPSDQEVVDDYKQRIAETRAHPSKEGEARLSDLTGPQVVSRDAVDDDEEERRDLEVADPVAEATHPASTGTARLDPADRIRLGSYLREYLLNAGESEDTVKYADWWLGQFDPERGGTEMSAAEQAKVFGVSKYVVHQMQRATRSAIRAVLAEKFGIFPPDEPQEEGHA